MRASVRILVRIEYIYIYIFVSLSLSIDLSSSLSKAHCPRATRVASRAGEPAMRSPRRRRGVHPAAATAPPCSAMASGAASPRSPPAAKKRAVVVAGDGDDSDVFDRLPDDIVLVVLSRLAANAASPADVASAALTYVAAAAAALFFFLFPLGVVFVRRGEEISHGCARGRRCRRFRELATHPAVLSRASAAAVAVRWGAWSEAAHRFLLRCAAAGSLHACYFLGMVRVTQAPLALLLCSVFLFDLVG